MFYLNLDSKTNRVLSAAILSNGARMLNSVPVESLPNGNIYDYRYVDGEYVYDPIVEEDTSVTTQSISQSAKSTESDQKIEARVSALEEKIDQLTEAINKLASK